MIKLVESSSTLNILLRLIYPVPNPPILGDNDKDGIEEPQTFIQAAESALSAAFKYEVSMVAEYLRTRLLAASETILDDGSYADRLLPLRLYALACRRGIKQEMRAAAQDCLLFQVADSDFPGLESISAKQYYRLLRFHESVAAAAIAALDTKKFHFRGCYRCDWWPAFTRLARDHLRQRPKTSYIRSIGFLAQVQAEAGCCCSCVPQWNMVLNHIESIVDKAIDKVSCLRIWTWKSQDVAQYNPRDSMIRYSTRSVKNMLCVFSGSGSKSNNITLNFLILWIDR